MFPLYGLRKANVLALNTPHVLRLNKADVLALSKTHVARLNTEPCTVVPANTTEAAFGCPYKGKEGGLRLPSPYVLSFVPCLWTVRTEMQQMCHAGSQGI